MVTSPLRIETWTITPNAEADKRRTQAAEATGEGLRRWLLKRASFFDNRATERAAETA